MNLHRLRCFLAVVDTGTVTAAARRLLIAQPALSRQVHALEKDVGLRLFARHHNTLRLTPAGVEFARMARHLLVQSESLRSAADALAAGAVRRLTVAATPASLSAFVAPFVATLGPADPLLLTRPESHFALYDALRAGADAIVSPAPGEEGFARQPLGAAPLQAHVAARHPWARDGRTAVGLAELLAEPLVLPSSSAVSRRVLDEAVARCGLTYGPVEECDDGGTAQAVAASGKGVAVVTDGPRYGVHPVPVRGDVGEPASALGVPLHVAWEPHHYAAEVIAALAERLATFLHMSAPWSHTAVHRP
ncbi:LysR family transcriptional regulator [Pseudonocardia kunmingensis]|uniref:LysR family transcriptional regulator n=1 Tax=Pseudonocardia kunmingensis TaxID=630975 RepID=UPI00147843FA|nr:LysR family transcriptional regulator [Pseudonocardia kunmingensis]